MYFRDDGTPREEGETITDPIFARTLATLAEDPLSFYNGSIAREMVKDIQDRGGILTMADLQNFTATPRRVLKSFVNDDILYTTSATSSGSTMIMILNILKGNFRSTEVSLHRCWNHHHTFFFTAFWPSPGSFCSRVAKKLRVCGYHP